MPKSLAVMDQAGTFQLSQGPRLPIYSLTKTFLAALILELGLDLEASIARWIPARICRHHQNIQLYQLLHHSSGLCDYGGLPAYQEDVRQRAQAWTDDEFIEKTLQQDLLFAPGSGFAYSNPGYWLIKTIAETASQMSLGELIQRYIQEPLELESICLAQGEFDKHLKDYPAQWVWHGLLLATARDVVKLMSSPLADKLNQRLIKVPYQDEFWQSPHYGLGLMVEPRIRYGHLGSGPGYEAACIRIQGTRSCACAIVSADLPIHPLRWSMTALNGDVSP